MVYAGAGILLVFCGIPICVKMCYFLANHPVNLKRGNSLFSRSDEESGNSICEFIGKYFCCLCFCCYRRVKFSEL